MIDCCSSWLKVWILTSTLGLPGDCLYIYIYIYMKLFMVDGVSCISALTTALWDFGDGLSSSFLLALKLGRCCKVFILIANKFQVLFSLSVKPNRGFRDHFSFQ